MRKITLSLAVVMTLVFVQQSMAVYYFLGFRHTGLGTFDVTLRLGRGATGIASYNIPVTGSFDSLDHNSPHTLFAQDAAFAGGPAGFSYMRSPDDVALLEASQDTISPTPHLIDGFGLISGSFFSEGLNPLAGTPDGGSWDAELRIASVTYSGTGSSFPFSPLQAAFVNVFLPDGSIVAADFFCPSLISECPEPTSLVLASLNMIGLLGCRSLSGRGVRTVGMNRESQ